MRIGATVRRMFGHHERFVGERWRAGLIQLIRRISRYAQVGLICAILNNAVVIAMDRSGYPYVFAVCAAFVISTPVGYLLHCAYTFQVPTSKATGVRFVIGNLIGFPITIGTMILLCSGLGIAASIAMPIVTLLLFGWNFLAAHVTIARVPTQLS